MVVEPIEFSDHGPVNDSCFAFGCHRDGMYALTWALGGHRKLGRDREQGGSSSVVREVRGGRACKDTLGQGEWGPRRSTRGLSP